MPKSNLEKLPLLPDTSLSTLDRRLEDRIPFEWHHHPEYELTLTLNSVGQRFVGDHVGEYGHGDLVLVGANLPHTWASRERLNDRLPHIALVIWFRQDWIDDFIGASVEFTKVRGLFKKAAAGLAFAPGLGLSFLERFEQALSSSPTAKLMTVLDILVDLAERPHDEALSTLAVPASGDNRSRIDRVLQYLHQDYARPFRMKELADLAALSESGLHRMFWKHTNTTMSAYVSRLRIGDACARLSASDQSVARIAAEVGYDNLSNFNRQFRALRGMTPSEYRASFKR